MTDAIRHFEDYHVGDVIDLGKKTVSRQDIIDFAGSFDPQPMHLDEEAAKHSLLGGLGASGWHTAVMAMRLLVDNLLVRSTGLGTLGVNRLDWLRPVRPGDTLHVRGEVLDTRPMRSRPDVGIVLWRISAANQAGEPVMTFEAPMMFALRAEDLTA